MDLSVSFQASFNQLVAQTKQRIIAEVHRSIDQQASSLYQLFLCELTKAKTAECTDAGAGGGVGGGGGGGGVQANIGSNHHRQVFPGNNGNSRTQKPIANRPTKANTLNKSNKYGHQGWSTRNNGNNSSSRSFVPYAAAAAAATTVPLNQKDANERDHIDHINHIDCPCRECSDDADLPYYNDDYEDLELPDDFIVDEEEEENMAVAVDEEEKGNRFLLEENLEGIAEEENEKRIEEEKEKFPEVVEENVAAAIEDNKDWHSNGLIQIQTQNQNQQPKTTTTTTVNSCNLPEVRRKRSSNNYSSESSQPPLKRKPQTQSQTLSLKSEPVELITTSSPGQSRGLRTAPASTSSSSTGPPGLQQPTPPPSGTRRKLPHIYHCEEPACGMSFQSSWLLTRHMRYHYQIKPFRCRAPGCGQAFIEHYRAVDHVKRFHLKKRDHRPGALQGPGDGSSGAAIEEYIETDVALMRDLLHLQASKKLRGAPKSYYI